MFFIILKIYSEQFLSFLLWKPIKGLLRDTLTWEKVEKKNLNFS
jgi:hypothetical protein